jgi:ankyrin repeat protein
VETFADVKDRHGKTALLLAVQTGKLVFAEELLKAGANPLIEDVDGYTVAKAAQKLNDPFMDVLLKK